MSAASCVLSETAVVSPVAAESSLAGGITASCETGAVLSVSSRDSKSGSLEVNVTFKLFNPWFRKTLSFFY